MPSVRIIDRYILKHVATPFMAALTIGLVMLLADRMVHLIDTTLGKKDSFGVVFELLAFLVPNYLGTAIPAGFFLGLLFGFNRLSANAETDALMAAGIGLHQIARPVIMLGAILSIVLLFIFGWAQPYMRYAYRSVIFQVENIQSFYLADEGVFMRSGTGTFILDKLDRSTNAFGPIFYYDDRGAKGSQTVTASRGVLVNLTGESRPVLHLEHGHSLDFSAAPSAGAVNPVPATVEEFGTLDTPLGRIGHNLFRPRGTNHLELTLPELIAHVQSLPIGPTGSNLRTELHMRLMNILSPLVLPFLALPFAIQTRRSRGGYRIGIALMLVVIFHEVVDQARIAAESGEVSPWLAIWLPFALLSLFAGWRYSVTCFTVNRNSLHVVVNRASEYLSWVSMELRKRWPRTGPA